MPLPDTDLQGKLVSLEIEVPASIADGLRARVASGEFASEGDAIVHLLLRADRMQAQLPGSEGEWDEEVRETILRLDQGEEPTYTLEELRQYFAQRRVQRTAA
jgi:Arc/MetJ-type ribon-helix-helix transcriptional regulator